MFCLGLEFTNIALGLVCHLVLDLATGDERVIDAHENVLSIELARNHLRDLVLKYIDIAI